VYEEASGIALSKDSMRESDMATLWIYLARYLTTFEGESKGFYSILFQSASEAILSLSASKKFLGFTPGFTAVLLPFEKGEDRLYTRRQENHRPFYQ